MDLGGKLPINKKKGYSSRKRRNALHVSMADVLGPFLVFSYQPACFLASVPLGLGDSEASAHGDDLEALRDGVLDRLRAQLCGGQLVGVVLEANEALLDRTGGIQGLVILFHALGHVFRVVPVLGVNVPVDDRVACVTQEIEHVVVCIAVGRAHERGADLSGENLFKGIVDYEGERGGYVVQMQG